MGRPRKQQIQQKLEDHKLGDQNLVALSLHVLELSKQLMQIQRAQEYLSTAMPQALNSFQERISRLEQVLVKPASTTSLEKIADAN